MATSSGSGFALQPALVGHLELGRQEEIAPVVKPGDGLALQAQRRGARVVFVVVEAVGEVVDLLVSVQADAHDADRLGVIADLDPEDAVVVDDGSGFDDLVRHFRV